MIKRKINDRGNGSCQIVVPKKVMEHLKITAGEEVEFVLIPEKDYVALKKYREPKVKDISMDKILKDVKEFTVYLGQEKDLFFKYNLMPEFYEIMNTALMMLRENTNTKIIEFLMDELETTITGMYGCDLSEYEELATNFIEEVHGKALDMLLKLDRLQELKEPEGFEEIINDLALIIGQYYSRSWKIEAIKVVVSDNLKEPSVDFETKVELIKVCMNLLEESGEENEDTELIQEFLEKALNSVYEEN